MDCKDIQDKFDKLDYWDCKVLDFSIHYFGDEVTLVIEDNNLDLKRCHFVSFLSCYSVSYKTDANDSWRSGVAVKTMSSSQLGHFLQSVIVKESHILGFLEIFINTCLLTATIVCKEVQFKTRPYKSFEFFWTNN